MTARTSNPGVGGITAEDLDALDQGRTTMQTIADRLGCTKQNISKRIRAMRSTSSTGPSIPIGATTTPTTTATGPTVPAGSVAVDPAEIATSACLGLLVRAHAALIGPDALGPSALKALSTTISTATAELRQLGVMASDDDESTLSVLTVRVMSDTEHDQAKAAAELLDDFEE